MSTNRSVDRSAVAHEKDRSAVAREKDRSAVAREKDRSYLCFFTFADGRRCSAPRLAGHPHLCCFHAKREARSLAAQQVGRDVSSFLSSSYVSACDLSSALACVFSAVAQGQVKPKTASTLAYLGQTLLQSIQVAQHEYINAFGTDYWRRTIRSSFAPPPAPPKPVPQPAPPQPALESTLAKV